ncbi:MAG: hypothetical protein BWY80_01437 [Firmicutes bacterium ADurb.Bin456]|nr:MAG: hypothetical protein BWY80_01437 [Firmicutes bacterium ADurb.Bin456]
MTVKWMPGNEGLALTRLPDGTCVFQVPVQVKVLEITIFLRRGADGKVTSIESIMLGFVPEDAGRPEDPTSPLHPGGPGKPAKPGGPTVRPGNPAVPPEQGGGSSAGGGSGSGGGGSGNGGSVPPSYGFNVLDTATCASYGTSGAIGVDIFGSHKRLAPGMNGRYLFTVDNTGNRYPSLYDVEFEVKDTLPGSLKIPLLYRLKADGVYVAGNESTWCTAPELYQKSVVAGGGGVEYTLDWHWPEGANDNEFSAYAGDPAYSYSLTVKVRAQAQ